MKKQVLILTLLVLMVLAVMPVQAVSITMSEPGGVELRDVIVYYENATMQGYYNSTSTFTIDANSSYIFVLKPVGGNVLSDPVAFMNQGFTYVETNVIPILVLVFIITLWWRR